MNLSANQQWNTNISLHTYININVDCGGGVWACGVCVCILLSPFLPLIFMNSLLLLLLSFLIIILKKKSSTVVVDQNRR